MKLTQQIAKHFRDLMFGGNWTFSNVKDNLSDVTWQQATTKVYDFNTIATLVFHMSYFVTAALQVLQGKPLDAHDKFSFDHPPINSKEDWEQFLNKVWLDAENFANAIEQLPDNVLSENFADEKYGNVYRNIHGIIEHSHYHLGQIVIIKKLLLRVQSDMEQ
ncbi:MAG: DUF1572 family protein [Bacteroidetes bacterium]|nr:DUF1572 family protein [Bacteroidota bacterium]